MLLFLDLQLCLPIIFIVCGFLTVVLFLSQSSVFSLYLSKLPVDILFVSLLLQLEDLIIESVFIELPLKQLLESQSLQFPSSP